MLKFKIYSHLIRKVVMGLVGVLIATAPVQLAALADLPGTAENPAAVNAPDTLSGRLSLAPANPVAPLAPTATTNTFTLRVTSARDEPNADIGPVLKGDPITAYKWQIVADNTGDPFEANPDCYPYLNNDPALGANPSYPGTCNWPGLRTVPGYAPVVTQGDQTQLDLTASLTLPDGKYLISVTADGYKIDGVHFTLPLEVPVAGDIAQLDVQMHPLPLPSATLVIKVFDDSAMTNGQYDAPVENGLAGFRASINDIAGEITADLFGNPLCTIYETDTNGNVVLDADGAPVIQTLGKGCYSDAEGMITIPNLGPLRYDVLVIPPDGTDWIQTTTLEGSFGWDTWLQEAGTGLDNEFVVAAEPFPWTIFGFVDPATDQRPLDPTGTGTVTGRIMAANVFTPFQAGLPYLGGTWGGLNGAKIDKPIQAWFSINDLQNGDQAIYVGQAAADGSFTVPNLPPGNYFMSYWDEELHYILEWVQFTVNADQTTDLGIRMLTGWFAEIYGTVFHDYNENGKRDPGEPGIPDYVVVLRDRDNTEIDRMSIAAVTDASGFYELLKAYPMGSWMVLEAYSDLYHTTGVTFQTSNQPEETTILGSGVDVGVLPILGQKGRLDWGVKAYADDENGGIAGSVFYDTVRAEDDARYAGVEPWQPGIPDLEMRLFEAKLCEPGISLYCDPTGKYELAADGSIAKTTPLPLASTLTESFVRAKGCTPRDVDGNPMDIPSLGMTGDPVVGPTLDCLEGPPMGLQFGTEFAALPGNWGFGELTHDGFGNELPAPVPMPAGNYLVEVVIPTDSVFGQPIYQVTREEDQNVFAGDTWTPQIPPPACAGPLHIVDIADFGVDGYAGVPYGSTGYVVPASTPVENPGAVEAGGSRFEGQVKPLCNVRLVELSNGKSVAPAFNLFTEVPIPGRWKGYIIDDLNLSADPAELFFGEKVGLPWMPIGVYDYTGRRVDTIYSDRHGVFEVLLPSTGTFNAPTPSGMLENLYYIYGNDPGTAANPDPYYNPQYRSIGTSFEIYPGAIIPADLAPVQNGIGFQAPTSNYTLPAACRLEDTNPQLFRVSRPYIPGGACTGACRDITIDGAGFGLTPGQVTLTNINGDVFNMPIVSWTETQIVINVPVVSPQTNFRAGEYQLDILANGLRTVNGLTIHVFGGGYQPNVIEVGPGRTFDPANYTLDQIGPIQEALNAAYERGGFNLVVVYPNDAVTVPDNQLGVFGNQRGVYFENLLLYFPTKIQGTGPGGIQPDGTVIPGAILDGRNLGGDSPYTNAWRELSMDIWENRGGWAGSVLDGDGNPILNEGAVVTVLAGSNEFRTLLRPQIDGFIITGGDQQGFPNNLNQIGGGLNGLNANIVVQGGGIFLNAYARYMLITNNLIQSNGGAYAGGIRVGTPHVPAPLTDHQNDFIRIKNNRIIANGGTNLAGAIGLFNGAEGYEIANNDICGNFSAEYGGGISHYGYSPNGSIHNNRILFNRSYDEGGGIIIAGELPADPNQLSAGAGPVEIFGNQIQGNLANDDGGGIRFLMSGAFPYHVYNNIVANNISTHEGGGISLNDAPYVRVYNNTIAKNITTATAMTSTGTAAPAGLSTSLNSNLLQITLPASADPFSNPQIFNNLFWDNRAGSWNGSGISGIGLPGDPNPVFRWDLGVTDNFGQLDPTYSLLDMAYPNNDPSNLIGVDPLFIQEYLLSIKVLPWRGNPGFVGANLVAVEVPLSQMGDYHVQVGSPVNNAGTASQLTAWTPATTTLAPNEDIDRQPRPSDGGYEIGADEFPVGFPATALVANAAIVPIESNAALTAALATQSSQTVTTAAPIPGTFVVLPMVNLDPFSGQTVFLGTQGAFNLVDGIFRVLGSGHMVYTPDFNANQEAFLTFTDLSATATRQDLLLKVRNLDRSGNIGKFTKLIDVNYDAVAQELRVRTLSPGYTWTTHAILGGISFKPGDELGVRAAARGILEVYLNGERILVADLVDSDTPWLFGNGGRIGVWYSGPDFNSGDPAGFTNFGGGTLP